MRPSETGVTRIVRAIRIRQVMWLTGLARSTIYDRINPASPRYDPSFPRPFRLGGEGSTAVGWSEIAIEEWVKHRMNIIH